MAALAVKLDVSPHLIARYVQGHEPIPDALFLRAVDFLLEELPATPPQTPPPTDAKAR